MSIFDQFARRQREICNGRILIMPGCWVFEPPNGYVHDGYQHQSTDATGRPMLLIRARSVLCYNPDVGADKFPQSTSSRGWFVPWAVCRKCAHYRKGGTDRLKYPHCAWVRERRGGDAGAAVTMLEILGAAIGFADNTTEGR